MNHSKIITPRPTTTPYHLVSTRYDQRGVIRLYISVSGRDLCIHYCNAYRPERGQVVAEKVKNNDFPLFVVEEHGWFADVDAFDSACMQYPVAQRGGGG